MGQECQLKICLTISKLERQLKFSLTTLKELVEAKLYAFLKCHRN